MPIPALPVVDSGIDFEAIRFDSWTKSHARRCCQVPRLGEVVQLLDSPILDLNPSHLRSSSSCRSAFDLLPPASRRSASRHSASAMLRLLTPRRSASARPRARPWPAPRARPTRAFPARAFPSSASGSSRSTPFRSSSSKTSEAPRPKNIGNKALKRKF